MSEELIQKLIEQNQLLLEKVSELEKRVNKADLKSTISCPLVSEEERMEATLKYNKILEEEQMHEENQSMFM